jgi:hypothetical protein
MASNLNNASRTPPGSGQKPILGKTSWYPVAVVVCWLVGWILWFVTRPMICPSERDWLNWGSKAVRGEVVTKEPGRERPIYYYWKVRQADGDSVNFYPFHYGTYESNPIEIGDSLFKEAGSFDVILIKKGSGRGTKFPFICPEGSTPFVPKVNGQ